MTLSKEFLAAANAAYERADQAWFNALPTDTLAAMWKLCCDIETMPSWDDEVYDALYPRGYFAVAKPDPAYTPGAIYPPISEWSQEDYDAFRASGQLD